MVWLKKTKEEPKKQEDIESEEEEELEAEEEEEENAIKAKSSSKSSDKDISKDEIVDMIRGHLARADSLLPYLLK